MCGRYALKAPKGELLEQLQVEQDATDDTQGEERL
jgi:putative SOS response-associated peptidase YedK